MRVLASTSSFRAMSKVITSLGFPNRLILPFLPSLYYSVETLEVSLADRDAGPARSAEWENLILCDVAFISVYYAALIMTRSGVGVVQPG